MAERILCGWQIYRESDPDAEIVQRRFGKEHDRPCHRPNVLTCAMPECQYANACQHGVPTPNNETLP